MTEYILQEEWAHIPEEDRRKIADAVAQDRNDGTDFYEVEFPNGVYVKFVKRLADILLSGIACIVLLPVNLVIAVVTFFDVGSPILFRQERIGKGGKPFYLVKFRNMTNQKNEDGVLLPPDQRVTKWGRFVRKSSLDELLNFWSILKGDMSLIGPRPMPTKYINRFSACHQQRHLVRPGLECPFHLPELAEKGWQGRLDNDVWYVKNISFTTDMKMAFLLVKKVFSKKERQASANGKTGEFIGYCDDGTVMDEWNIPRKYLQVIEKKERVGV